MTEQAKKSVARSTAVMSLCTLASRATGFIRTWAMAFALGNTILAAGFSLANNLPNMIYELVAGGVLSTAFLPIYLQQRNQRNAQAGNEYASNLLSIVIVALGLISIAACVFAAPVMTTQSLFSSHDAQTVSYAVKLFRLLAFEILFYGISAVFGGILNAEREFFWPAISSIFMNLISIIAFFAFPAISGISEEAGLIWLGAMMVLSILLMAFVQIPALKKTGFKFKFRINFKGEGLGETVRLALPAIACTAINLVSLSFMNSCALHVAANGPASVSYAWMWYQFPYGVLGVALSTALFTEMSECTARKDWDGFRENLLKGLRTTWMLIIPMATMVAVCASQLIGLYAAGNFTAEGIRPAAALLEGWGVNLPLYAGYMFVYRAYSACKDMKTVAICNLFLTIVQVLLYMTFTGVIGPGFGLGLVGIAATDICFYGLMLVVLLAILKKRMDSLNLKSLVVPTIKISVASLIGGAVAWFVAKGMNMVLNTEATLGALGALVVTGIAGLVVIFVLARAFGVQELVSAVNAVKRKIKR